MLICLAINFDMGETAGTVALDLTSPVVTCNSAPQSDFSTFTARKSHSSSPGALFIDLLYKDLFTSCKLLYSRVWYIG